MPTALVLDGSSGPALSVVRSLGGAGWRVLVQSGTRSARSRFADRAVEIPDAGDHPEGFADAVRDTVASTEVDVVVPCTDAAAELLWGDEAQLGGAGILGGSRASFELCSDKLRTLEAADAFGFPTPRWFRPADVDDAVGALRELALPAVAKPRRSYTREGRRLAQHRFEFVSSADELVPWFAAGRLPIVQEYVPGRAISVSVVLHEGELLAAVAREAFSFVPVRGGTSVWKRTIELQTPGVELALRFLREIDFEGLGELEYQLDGAGAPRLMEINARAHGWVGLAVAAGVDLPLIAAQAMRGESVKPQLEYRVGVEMRWPAGELLRVRAALSRSPALPPGTTRRDVLASLWPPWRPGMRYDGLDVTDPGPWIPWLAERSQRRPDRP
jgi:predicted ATP-grasp superfamily ATP-dependent carboligase